MTPYYYVNRIGPGGNAPSFRHPTLAKAQAEAERLAGLNPGVAFEILKCVAVSQIVKPSCTTFFTADDEEPKVRRVSAF